jgi:hypothetical protein
LSGQSGSGTVSIERSSLKAFISAARIETPSHHSSAGSPRSLN